VTENEEEEFYDYKQVGHESSREHKLPEKIQLKGWYLGAYEDEFDLAWYVKEDIKDREKNLILQVIASLLLDNGFNVGWLEDEHDPENMILVIDLPQGQVSYDIPKSLMIAKLPVFEGVNFRRVGWEQCDRLQQFIENYNDEPSNS
jgi:hypothetical protein